MSEAQENRRGQRHLRVAIEVGAQAVQPVSAWVVEQPAVQQSRIVGPVLVRSSGEGRDPFVEGFDDPRIARGVSRPETLGHSEHLMESGVVYVSVPLAAGQGVDDLDIEVAIADQVGTNDARAVAAMFDEESSPMRVMGHIDGAALRELPDWPSVAAALGAPE